MIFTFDHQPFAIIVSITKMSSIDDGTSMIDYPNAVKNNGRYFGFWMKARKTYGWVAIPFAKDGNASFHKSVTLLMHSRSSSRQANWMIISFRILCAPVKMINMLFQNHLKMHTVDRRFLHHPITHPHTIHKYVWQPFENIAKKTQAKITDQDESSKKDEHWLGERRIEIQIRARLRYDWDDRIRFAMEGDLEKEQNFLARGRVQWERRLTRVAITIHRFNDGSNHRITLIGGLRFHKGIVQEIGSIDISQSCAFIQHQFG